MPQVLVVDVANVVGSRPDGWWRDRVGAARRLREQVAQASLPYDEVVLVLEGQGRGGGPAGQDGWLSTVHADASGDDAIVEVVARRVGAGDDVLVVTADRTLKARVEAAGARSAGPSWLLNLI